MMSPLLALALGCSSLSVCGAPAPHTLSIEAGAAQNSSFEVTSFTQPHPRVSPDGRRIYFDMLGEIYHVSIEGGRAERLNLGTGWKSNAKLSPDGNSIAFLSDRNGEVSVWTASLEAPSPASLAGDTPGGRTSSHTWLSERSVMAASRSATMRLPYSLSVIDLRDEHLQSPVARMMTNSMVAALSSDHAGRVYFQRGGDISELTSHTGVERVVLPAIHEASQPQVTPDMRLAYVADADGEDWLFIRDLVVEEVLRTPCKVESPQSDNPLEPTYDFTPDMARIILSWGGRIASCDLATGELRDIPVVASADLTLSPRPRASLPESDGLARHTRFIASDPTSDRLAFVAQGRIWVNEDGVNTRLTTGEETEYTPSFSPSGRWIAFGSTGEDGQSRLRLHDLQSGASAVLASSSDLIVGPAWSPDGTRLAWVDHPRLGADRSASEIRWAQADGGAGGLIAEAPMFARLPVLTWDRLGQGVFFTQESSLQGELGGIALQLSYGAPGRDPAALFHIAEPVWDIRVSPNGRYVAIQDRSGLRVAPMSASSAENVQWALDRSKIITTAGVDYFAWKDDETLVWSFQDTAFGSSVAGEFAEIADLATALPENVESERVAYLGADLIDMVGDAVIRGGVLITRDGKIEFVGGEIPSNLGPVDRTVDVLGKTIIPGLIDTHTHVGNRRRWNVEAGGFFQPTFAQAAYGVTSVFDPQHPTIESGVISEASQSDAYLGATYYGSGSGMLGSANNPESVTINSQSDADLYVSLLARSGALMVKDYTQPTRREHQWLANSARRYGVGITAHALNDVRDALSRVEEGYNALEHVILTQDPLHEDVRQFLIRSEVGLTPTLVVEGEGGAYLLSQGAGADLRFRCLARPAWMPEEFLSDPAMSERLYLDGWGYRVAKEFADILNRGGNVSIGGHGLAPGIDTHWEMWLLELAGARPLEVLRAATVNGARKLGLDDRIGQLRPGMDADFVVLNSSPLENIRNTTDISQVIRRGQRIAWPAGGQPSEWSSDEPWHQCQRWNLGE